MRLNAQILRRDCAETREIVLVKYFWAKFTYLRGNTSGALIGFLNQVAHLKFPAN